MSKTDALALLEAGIRVTGLRQAAIASNIANVETVGYRRVDVDFPGLLARAVRNGTLDPEHVPAEFSQPLSTPVNERGNDVQIEMEVGQMIQNDVERKTYLRLLSKLYGQAQAAMRTE
jgi:flagellar basal-body rod protein FlgB